MSSMSTFGRSILEKYGWSEGKGLGREESGCVSAIKVKGNFESYGLGHDVGKQFKSQWWDHVYNSAADNMSIEKSETGSLEVTKKAEFQIDKRVVPYNNLSYGKYSNFIKAGELYNKPEVKDMSLNLSYEELFKLCGGRTAHKGARHGLTMSAKLSRVEKQERELMEKWKTSTDERVEEGESSEGKHKKSKKKKRKVIIEDDNSQQMNVSINEDIGDVHSEPVSRKHKKDKKKKKHRIEDEYGNCALEGLPHEEPQFAERYADTQNLNGEVPRPKLSKKERKLLSKSEDFPLSQEHHDDIVLKEDVLDIVKKSKKKKKAKECEKENSLETTVPAFENEAVVKKKKKKKRDVDESSMCENNSETGMQAFENEAPVVKKKKKKRDLVDSVMCEDLVESNPSRKQLDVDNECQIDEYHHKKKKRKKSKREEQVEMV